MPAGIRRIIELFGEEGAVLVGESLGRAHHAAAALGRRRQDDLRAQRAHQLAPLDREAVGHEGDEGIAARRADHRQRDAGVAGGRLDHHLPGLSTPRCSASRMMPSARRSFTEDIGLKASSLAYMVTPLGASLLMRTIGVLPTVPGCRRGSWQYPLLLRRQRLVLAGPAAPVPAARSSPASG
jgi:hypothetical protein